MTAPADKLRMTRTREHAQDNCRCNRNDTGDRCPICGGLTAAYWAERAKEIEEMQV